MYIVLSLTNQKLISAMLVGISAMMSISSPITAYAQDDENNIPDITPETAETSENENTESSSEESVTAEAQELATETTEAIEEASETLETIENVEEASIESLETAAIDASASPRNPIVVRFIKSTSV